MNEKTKLRLLFILLFILMCIGAFAQSYDSVKVYINKSNLEHKDIILKQAVLETGWFKCTNCSRENNNLFGWYYKKKYLKFDNWKDSIDYYVRWQERHYKTGDYYDFLINKGFATDTLYINKLKNIKL